MFLVLVHAKFDPYIRAPSEIQLVRFAERPSTALVIRCNCVMALQKILLGTDRKVIPRQLLQSLRDPSFGILIGLLQQLVT